MVGVTPSIAADYAKRLECGAFPPLLYSHRRCSWLYESCGSGHSSPNASRKTFSRFAGMLRWLREAFGVLWPEPQLLYSHGQRTWRLEEPPQDGGDGGFNPEDARAEVDGGEADGRQGGDFGGDEAAFGADGKSD